MITDPFKGKVIAVTGAASGIGAAAAKIFKSRGASVIAFDRIEPDKTSADEFIKFDQSDEGSTIRAITSAPTKLDGLINIAGAPPSDSISPQKLLLTNFYGLRLLTEGLLKRMRPGGAIVNMSSHAGHGWRENIGLVKTFMAIRDPAALANLIARHQITLNGLGNSTAYPLSKQLLNLWTILSYTELEPLGLRMNAVTAAGVSTPILDDFLASFGEESAARIIKIGLASPEDVAAVIVFLASDDAKLMKSAIIPADSGASALAAINQYGLKASA